MADEKEKVEAEDKKFTLTDLVDKVFVKSTKEMYEEFKMVKPSFILFREDKESKIPVPEIIPIPDEMMNMKDLLSSVLKHAVKENMEGLVAVMFISEAWMIELSADGETKEIPRSLAEHPNRKEIIMFTLETVDCIRTKRVFISEGKVLKEDGWDDMTKGQGRLLGYGLCKDFKDEKELPDGFKFAEEKIDGGGINLNFDLEKKKPKEKEEKKKGDKFNYSYG